MYKLLKHINEIDRNNKVEDNLYVKNIIVNKDKSLTNVCFIRQAVRYLHEFR